MRSTPLIQSEVHNIIMLTRHSVQQISRLYSSSITESLKPLNNNSPFPLLPSPGQPILHSLLLRVTVLDTSCEWNHAVFISL